MDDPEIVAGDNLQYSSSWSSATTTNFETEEGCHAVDGIFHVTY